MPDRKASDLAGDAIAQSVAASAVEFTDEQRSKLREAFFEAELALLKAISSQAVKLGDFETSRNLSSLVASLQGLRAMAGQSSPHLWAVTRGPGWVGYAPNTGEACEDDD